MGEYGTVKTRILACFRQRYAIDKEKLDQTYLKLKFNKQEHLWISSIYVTEDVS